MMNLLMCEIFQTKRPFLVGIWCQNDVVSTLMRRHFGTKCPLGFESYQREAVIPSSLAMLVWYYLAELQIKGGIEDNAKIFLISQ